MSVDAYCPSDDELIQFSTRYPEMKSQAPDWMSIKSDLILAGEDAMQIERWPAKVVMARLAGKEFSPIGQSSTPRKDGPELPDGFWFKK